MERHARDQSNDDGHVEGHIRSQQMLEAIGTRSSRLGQSGPPIAQRPYEHHVFANDARLPSLIEFERLLDFNLGVRTMKGNATTALNEWSPAADIHETEEALTFAVELPGIAPDQVEVKAEGGRAHHSRDAAAAARGKDRRAVPSHRAA